MNVIDTSIEDTPLFPPSSLFPLLNGRKFTYRSSSSSSSSSFIVVVVIIIIVIIIIVVYRGDSTLDTLLPRDEKQEQEQVI